jgi:hypothetical protein
MKKKKVEPAGAEEGSIGRRRDAACGQLWVGGAMAIATAGAVLSYGSIHIQEHWHFS